MTPEAIAAVCHEANRRYCKILGDNTQLPWEEAAWYQRQSAIAGVMFVLQHPDSPLSAQHDNWRAQKVAEGWKYAPVKDDSEKLHPCILPYDELSEDQRRKDKLFRNITIALKGD